MKNKPSIKVEVEEDAVYISDEYGEIVMWHLDEIEEDSTVGLVIANALKLVYEKGPEALRNKIHSPIRLRPINSFEDLVGVTLSKIKKTDDEIVFFLTNGEQYKLYHSQDCCEHVYVEDVIGDLDDLIGSPLTMAEEASNEEEPSVPDGYHESYTWTFYKLATVKGYVTIRRFASTARASVSLPSSS
jgi:hypothetical protein